MPTAALEMAAKYVCNAHCGRCPQMVLTFPCPCDCNLETRAWQCWINYFQSQAGKAEKAAPQDKAARHDGSSPHSP